MSEEFDFQVALNTCAQDIFRLQADQDYISARSNYFMEFQQQFLWSAQQAVEKYLKAILLYNGNTARWKKEPNSNSNGGKPFGHDLIALNSKVRMIGYLDYSIPDWGESFLEYLSKFGGVNRYLSHSSYTTYEALEKLDELVWHIRRYCFYIPENSEKMSFRDATINCIKAINFPTRHNLTGGRLEKILKSNSISRDLLVRENRVYGTEDDLLQKTQISSSIIPPQDRDWFTDEMKERLEYYIQP
ncbi:hypothetical protein A8139_02375 [Marinomonas primoryensis]|uniref:HEPN domain-containing protein n=1 Tax=Marinomonas primoryensis TaxID=178399 RepID=A0A2Z4PN12_9GAMM|nr:HEPN domain-containing protein [Marinomonas primoryensis]AWX98967.1 hypothetical protein A8139_02375 [Marinomonas primoryensis]